MALSMIECANAILLNGLGRYDEALAPAQRACAHDELSLYGLALVELVEAAARSDNPSIAAAALERLSERTRASGTDWALGLEARSRAFVTDGPAAGDLYEEAVERLGRGRLAPHRARAQLVYGEWLRREKRRLDARDQLRAAHDTFTGIGAKAFAERARRELQATGEPPASAARRPAMTSRPRRLRSPALPETGSPTPRSAPGSSSARERSSTTCTRCSPSSTSARATNSGES